MGYADNRGSVVCLHFRPILSDTCVWRQVLRWVKK